MRCMPHSEWWSPAIGKLRQLFEPSEVGLSILVLFRKERNIGHYAHKLAYFAKKVITRRPIFNDKYLQQLAYEMKIVAHSNRVRRLISHGCRRAQLTSTDAANYIDLEINRCKLNENLHGNQSELQESYGILREGIFGCKNETTISGPASFALFCC